MPHDKAIIRALNSVYKPNVKLKSNPDKTFFVGNLNPTTDEVRTLLDVNFNILKYLIFF